MMHGNGSINGSVKKPLRFESGARGLYRFGLPALSAFLLCAADAAAQASVPQDLSVSGMFMAADGVVKAVMAGLVLASVLTWTVWIAKTRELSSTKKRIGSSTEELRKISSLDEAAVRVKGGEAGELLNAARSELRLSAGLSSKGSIKERVSLSLERIEAQAGRRLRKGTGILATIGATAPFVGLFGTVWGIMNSFIGISKSQTTNLAVVAPGIAEALLATAAGLVAAIPAVIIYNHFARSISERKAELADMSTEVLKIVSRDLDRSAGRSGEQEGSWA